jgi:hypothetical protein
VTEATMAGYADALAALWQFEAASGPEVGHGARPVVMTLTAEGRAAFVRYVNDLYAQLADPELPEYLRGPYAKLEGYAARLALILHVCRLVTGETEAESVEEQSVTAAIVLVHYFQAHAKRVYARLRSTRVDQRADKAIQWIQAHGNVCTVQDLQRHRVAGLTRALQADKLLRDLVDLGAGELRERRLPSGRMQKVFVLDPHAAS